jgi:ribosomal protein L2
VKNIPVGYLGYNVELRPGKGGTNCKISRIIPLKFLLRIMDIQHHKMPSGEARKVLWGWSGVYWTGSNIDYALTTIGKSWPFALVGEIRPTVRGNRDEPR